MSTAPQLSETADDEAPRADAGDTAEARSRAPAWLISLGAHAALLTVMAAVVATVHQTTEQPPVRHAQMATMELPKPPDDQRVIDPSEKFRAPIEVEDEVESPDTSEIIPDIVEVTTTEDNEPTDSAKGRADAVAISEDGGPGIASFMGAGGGASGRSGTPWGGNLAKVRKEGGKPGSIGVVMRSLKWFKRHQSENGQWDVDGYPRNCDAGIKCEPGQAHTDEAGDVACTGYALMCFIGFGYDHKTVSEFRQTVKKGIDWLVSVQKQDGSFGERNYEHAVATMALCDAYGMSNDPALRVPCQKAIDVLVARQNREAKGGYGLGWDYKGAKPSRNDSSVSGWCVMALKSGQSAGLSVGDSVAGAKSWLDKAWKAANPNHAKLDPYTGRSVFPYTWNGEDGSTEKDHLAAVGAMCAVFLGHKKGDAMLETLCNQIMATDYQASLTYPTNTYLLYYNTMAIFQASDRSDRRWIDWSDKVCGMLMTSQRRDECFDGSWDFVGTGFHGHETGRLLSTAYCCLSLEVYYRKAKVDGT